MRPAQAYQLRRFVGRLEPGQSVRLDDGAADEFLPGTAEALLTVSPRPDWDVPGLLRALDRYAYGCLEQTTSRAMPLLYVDAVAQLWRTEPGFSPAETIDRAIGHVVELQRSDGSFGVWSDSDDTVPWLDAYATDFLLRAKQHGKAVPDHALTAALGWLRDYVRQPHTEERSLPAVAYAHYVLAQARMGELPALRYFTDTQLATCRPSWRAPSLPRRWPRRRYDPRHRRLSGGAGAAAEAAAASCAMSITAAICATAPGCWPLPAAIRRCSRG